MTSSNQDIKTSVATSMSMQKRSVLFFAVCFCLRLPWKRLCRLVVVLSSLDDVTRRPLIEIIAGLPFGDLSNGERAFSTRIVYPDPNLKIYLFFSHKNCSSVRKKKQKQKNQKLSS